ncbi:MAG: short-chain fatty acid transporter [Phycisphaeraceae bacterium]|nr:short-chain fatty acid transporter [Phycisphaeraceae bacterium]
MISRLGEALGRAFRATAPDPFVIALLLTLLTGVLAVGVGFTTLGDVPCAGVWRRAVMTIDAWGAIARPDQGLWSLLAFAMQMCLVLVTGHAMASAPVVRSAIERVASWPGNARQAVAMVAVVACFTGVVNWGLGLIVGALLARDVGAAMRRKGVRVPMGLLAAAGYSALLVWHGGLSGSAPLSVTTVGNALKTFSPEQLRELGATPAGMSASEAAGLAWIGLDRTVGSRLNVLVTGGLIVLTPLVYVLLAPRAGRDGGEVRVERGTPAEEEGGRARRGEVGEAGEMGRVPDWLERSAVPAVILASLILVATVRFAGQMGWGRFGLDQINGVMLALGLVLHGGLRPYALAAEEGARACAGIIIQFPLYAGIMAMMEASGLVRMFASGLTELGTERTTPVFSFVSAAVVNVFIPSGGGQWAVQGPIALSAGSALGIAPERMVMSVAYGDQLTNMLQPFWALPLLAITRTRAAEVVGYTCVAMIAAGAWIVVCLLATS